MTRKIKLGWGKKRNAFSRCEGRIISKNSYEGYSICWVDYEGKIHTYLIRPDGYTYRNRSFVSLDRIKEYLEGTGNENIHWYYVGS